MDTSEEPAPPALPPVLFPNQGDTFRLQNLTAADQVHFNGARCSILEVNAQEATVTVQPGISTLTFEVPIHMLAPNADDPPPLPEGYSFRGYHIQRDATADPAMHGEAHDADARAAPPLVAVGAAAGA